MLMVWMDLTIRQFSKCEIVERKRHFPMKSTARIAVRLLPEEKEFVRWLDTQSYTIVANVVIVALLLEASHEIMPAGDNMFDSNFYALSNGLQKRILKEMASDYGKQSPL